MSDKIRLAVIGAGQRGPSHARAIQRCQETKLVLVCDRDESRAQKAAIDFGVGYVLDHREAIQRDDVDALAIATHTRHHVEVMRDVVQAGKPFLVEKPYAADVGLGKSVCEIAERNGVVAMVGFQLRFTPFAQQIKVLTEQIDLVQANVSLQRGFFNPQYFFAEHYSGILDALSHTIDLALWWTEAPPVEVIAHQQTGLFKPDKKAVEFTNILARCQGGQMICMTGSMAGLKMQNIFQLVGTKGNISALDQSRIRYLTHHGFKEDKIPINLQEGEWYNDGQAGTGMWTHFATCVRDGKTDVSPGASLREGLAGVAVSQAAYASSKERKAISITL